jgi:hypothetical protein
LLVGEHGVGHELTGQDVDHGQLSVGLLGQRQRVTAARERSTREVDGADNLFEHDRSGGDRLGQRPGEVSTGQRAFRSTFLVTYPSNRRSNPEAPCVPMTMRSALIAAACSRISATPALRGRRSQSTRRVRTLMRRERCKLASSFGSIAELPRSGTPSIVPIADDLDTTGRHAPR